MKKLSLLIIFLISLFIFTGNVLAKECAYSNYDNSMAANKYKVSFDVDDSGKISNVEGLPISNWDDVKSTYTSGKKCPTYSYVYNSKLYLYYDYDKMISDATDRKATILNSLTYAEDTGDTKKNDQAKEELKSLNERCKGVAATKFDYTKCWDESKVTTKYTECKNEAKALGSQIRSKVSELNGLASTNTLSKSSSEFQEMEKNCAAALSNVADYEEALKYTSCKEYNAAMGTNIKCSTTDEDVKDNKYVDKGNNTDDSVKVQNVDNCQGVFGTVGEPDAIATYLQTAFNLMKFLGPILVLVLSVMDLIKITAEGKQDDQLKKLGIKTMKRLVYAVIIFVLPEVINYIFTLVGLYGTCGIS